MKANSKKAKAATKAKSLATKEPPAVSVKSLAAAPVATPNAAPNAATPNASQYSTRICVPAPMPIACPKCHSQKTVIDKGVYYNTRTATRFENRTCHACGFTFTSYRPMTKEEIAQSQAKIASKALPK